jgi:hypothetical protein
MIYKKDMISIIIVFTWSSIYNQYWVMCPRAFGINLQKLSSGVAKYLLSVKKMFHSKCASFGIKSR